MMKIIVVLLSVLFLAGAILGGIQAVKVIEALGKISHHQQAFVRYKKDASKKVLFAGDSTAVGTGSGDSFESVAGWFAQDFPDAHIEQLSANGRRLAELDALFELADKRYDMIVLQIGANDIMKFTPLKQSAGHIRSLVHKAKKSANVVVILHSGNIGLAPVFSWPFNWVLTKRSQDLRRVYQQTAREEGVVYVDLFQERSEDVFLKDIDKYYAPDRLHPSGQGYRWWYERIRMALNEAKIVL